MVQQAGRRGADAQGTSCSGRLVYAQRLPPTTILARRLTGPTTCNPSSHASHLGTKLASHLHPQHNGQPPQRAALLCCCSRWRRRCLCTAHLAALGAAAAICGPLRRRLRGAWLRLPSAIHWQGMVITADGWQRAVQAQPVGSADTAPEEHACESNGHCTTSPLAAGPTNTAATSAAAAAAGRPPGGLRAACRDC